MTKEKILESLCKLIQRIRIKYRDPIVTVYGDLNTNKSISIWMIERKTKFKTIFYNK